MEGKLSILQIHLLLGNTRATYGDLDHILAFATANECIQFFRMSLAQGAPTHSISPPYHV